MESPTETESISTSLTKAPQGTGAASPAAEQAPGSLTRGPVGARPTSPAEFDDLLARAQAGDHKAFGALIADARPRALAVALKVLRNPDDAEDAVQEAFVKVWRYLERFERRSSFSTWIHRIVMNASLDLLRRQSCRPEAHAESEETQDRRQPEPAHEETPEHTLVQAQTGALVRAALSSLSPPHRQALTLREFEDRSYEEIAQASECPIGTVMSRLHHARRKLADELRATNDFEPTLRAA
jgi:RNA polymerase sigma-70 factor (ECF subfamily)